MIKRKKRMGKMLSILILLGVPFQQLSFGGTKKVDAETITINITNGSFEDPQISTANQIFDQSDYPGWRTTASDGKIEIQRKDGNQFAEINANEVGALYQDIQTTPGTLVYWHVSHRGRMGVDSALVEFGSPNGELEQIETMVSDETAWIEYSGTYLIPEGQEITRFQFRSISSTGGPTLGNFLDNVEFTSEFVKGSVNIHYESEDGTGLAPTDLIEGGLGLSYMTKAKEIAGWKVKETPENAKGVFTDTAQDVIYVYERADAAPVTVHYESEAGVELAPSEILEGKVGLSYTTEAKEIAGWEVKETPGNATGVFTDTAQDVIYVYERVDAAPVTVYYESEAGVELASSEILEGKVGLPYMTEAKEIAGWKVKEIPGNAKGVFTNTAQDVTYVYERADAAPVTVYYESEAGVELAPPEILEGKVGLPYTTEAKEIEGWRVEKTPENATGIFTDTSQKVTYKYTMGELLFVSAPSKFDFGEGLKITSKPKIYPVVSMDGKLSVQDTRVNKESWTMTAKMQEVLTSTENHKLPNALQYAHNGEMTVIGLSDIFVYEEISMADEVVNISDNWASEGEGLFLEIYPGEAYSEAYTGVINWTLQNTPANQ